MLCRLCLIESEDYKAIFTPEGIELDIKSVIKKYFQLKILIDDPVSTCICNSCWIQLSNFQEFCSTIEDAQSKLSEGLFQIKNNDLYSSEDEKFYEDAGKEGSCNLKIDTISTEQQSYDLHNIKNENEGFCSNTEDNLNNGIDEKYETKIEEKSKNQSKYKKRGRPKKVRSENVKEINYKEEKSKENHSEEEVKESTIYSRLRRRTHKETEKKIPKKLPKVKIKNEKKEKSAESSDYVQKSKEADEKIAKYMKMRCQLCPAECTKFSQIRSHYRQAHKCTGYVVCCNKKFYRRIYILDHINKHMNPDFFKCDLCDKTFSDRNCLRGHKIIMHAPDEHRIYKCDKCPRSYSRVHLLKRHTLIHVPEEERTFVCKPCGKSFPAQSLLYSHTRQVHDNAYGIMCHICAKVLQGKTMLARHQLEHAGVSEPKVQCEECGSWLRDKYGLKKHMERHAEKKEDQLNPKEYKCNFCEKICHTRLGLKSHVRYAHQSKPIHKCNICNKSFKRSITLKEHMTTHTGEVLYTCPHCPKTFNSSANMHSHRKKKHRQQWEEARKAREKTIENFRKKTISDDSEHNTNHPREDEDEGNSTNDNTEITEKDDDLLLKDELY